MSEFKGRSGLATGFLFSTAADNVVSGITDVNGGAAVVRDIYSDFQIP